MTLRTWTRRRVAFQCILPANTPRHMAHATALDQLAKEARRRPEHALDPDAVTVDLDEYTDIAGELVDTQHMWDGGTPAWPTHYRYRVTALTRPVIDGKTYAVPAHMWHIQIEDTAA